MTGIAVPTLLNTYNPLPWQVAPWRDKSPIMLLTGSAGGGKSRLYAEKLHAYMLKYPGAMGLMVRKTRNSMTNSTVLFVERAVIGHDPNVTHYPSKSRFEYSNGSILAYGGMANEEQREQIRSIGQDGGLDIAWMEEATRFTEDDFNELLPRMRGKAAPWRQIGLTTNPDTPYHWVYQRLIRGGEAKVYTSGARDNPYNPADYLDALDKLTGPLRDRLRDGKWVQAEGAIYPQWDATVHLVDPFPIPAGWRRFRSVDFGYTNPFVCQWWAVDPDGRMYLYREIYQTQRLVEDMARRIVSLSEGESLEATVADHDAEDRATLERYGVPSRAAQKDVSVGLQAVAARLRPAGDGKPRLYVLRDALVEADPRLVAAKLPTSTEEEVPGYVWQQAPEGRAAKEEPLKVNDHGMDAMRYAVMYLEHAGPVRVVENPFYA
jgi:PBSX family phage terminase large subunit